MNNELETVSIENTETIEVKKPTRGKKAAVSADNAASAPAAESPAPAKAEKKPKARKQYDLHDLTDVRNMTPGRLIYKSARNAGYMVEWDSYGDEQSIEISELKNMLASQRVFFERNWIWIDDPELLEFLGAARYYKNMLSPDAVDALFELDAEPMLTKIRGLTKDMQNTIRVIAREKVKSGEIESYSVVQALEKYFNTRFDEE
ncbi:MAG: hypothetical protein J6S14_17305 [Clostridia bacterium]|nr:hypothetical protein [Clostridia bacterium]